MSTTGINPYTRDPVTFLEPADVPPEHCPACSGSLCEAHAHAPLDLLAAYDAGPRYEMPDGRTVTITTADVGGGRAWVVLKQAGFNIGQGVLTASGHISCQTGQTVSDGEWNTIGQWLAAEIRGRIELRDRTIASLEHLDRVLFKAGRQPESEDALDARAFALVSLAPASFSMLQHTGIVRARIADLIRSGVLVPVLPS